MKIIIDTNLWVSYLISERVNGLKDLCLDENISVFYSDECIEEFIRVSNKPKIRKRGVEEQHISIVKELIKTHCVKAEIKNIAETEVRDPKDVYLLSLADAVEANFLLTGDKDLLVLGRHNSTEIISYSQFMIKYNSLAWRLKRFFKNFF